MKLRNLFPQLLLTACVLVTGCSTTGQKLDEKLAAEPAKTSRAEIRAETDFLIENDASLSDDQKKRLSILRSNISAKLDELSDQSLKLRSVLVEEILSPNYSMNEVSLIKKRLKKIEDRRLTVMFDGVDQANSILGRDAQKHSRVMRNLLESRTTRE